MYTDASLPTLHELPPHLTECWKGGPMQWEQLSNEKSDTLATLQQNLIAAPVLAWPRSEAYLTLDTDACEKQFGCGRCRIRQVEQWSRCRIDPERLTSQSRTMTRCIVNVLPESWPSFTETLYWRAKFTIPSDHDAPRWIMNFADSTGHWARWRPRLSELQFDVVRGAGLENQAADALLQLETEGKDKTLLEDDALEVMVSLVQHRDPTTPKRTAVMLKNIVNVKAAGSPKVNCKIL